MARYVADLNVTYAFEFEAPDGMTDQDSLKAYAEQAYAGGEDWGTLEDHEFGAGQIVKL